MLAAKPDYLGPVIRTHLLEGGHLSFYHLTSTQVMHATACLQIYKVNSLKKNEKRKISIQVEMYFLSICSFFLHFG